MKYKIYSDGTVVNCIEATEDFCAAYCAEMGYTYEADPLPVYKIDPEPSQESRLTALEEALAQTDEVAIELYEANMTQEEINQQQDEALLEIYERMGGV